MEISIQGTARFPMRWICTSFCFASALLAQDQAPVIFKADSNLQTVAVQVRDRQGRAVGGLTAPDFTISEDGRPQKIAFFGTEDEPMSLAILLDTSSSMSSSWKLERAQALLVSLISNDRPQDEIFLVPFTDRIGRFVPLTPEQRLKTPRVNLPSVRDGTALYDALAITLCHLRESHKLRQAVLVITDGADQNSRLRIEQLIRLAGSSRPEIFMIGIWGKGENDYYRESENTVTLVSGHEIDNPLRVFARIAKETGAESYFPATDRDLKQVLEHISAILRAQYTLAYYPENTQKVRKIAVKVHRGGVIVTAPRSVSGQAAEGESVRFNATSCEISPTQHPYPWEPLVTAPKSGPTMYREDFANSLTGWPNRPGSRYASGAYEISRKKPSGDTSPELGVADGTMVTRKMPSTDANPQVGLVDGTIVAYGPWWDNFAASITVEEPAGAKEEAAGLLFRFNAGGSYAVLLTRIGTPHSAFKLVKRNWVPLLSSPGITSRETIIVPWTELSEQGLELPHRDPAKAAETRLKVECKGDQITIWLDDIQVARVKDRSFADGYVGMAQFGYGRALFRELEVKSLR